MSLIVGVLVIGLIFLWAEVSALKGRVTILDDQAASAKDLITELTGRLRRLEVGRPATAEAPLVVATPPPVVVEPPPVLVTPPPVVVTPPPVVVEAPPVAVTPAVAVTPPPVVAAPPQVVVPPPPVAVPVPPVVASASAAALEPEGKESWEMVVGTSWLNKLGVLVVIVGVALLVSYSFAHVGAAGRVAIGYALSLSMLGGGVVLERRAEFRNYAYGLVAGGWAGTYFTTYAMHDVPAAKIIENDLAAVTLLSAVAAAMIAHSLRYRSQIVTSLTFIVAYVTLCLTPLSGFSLAASVPLALSVLVVSQRLGWPGVSTMGISATYGAFILRGTVLPGGGWQPGDLLPFITLASYWVAFETADIIGLRAQARSTQPRPSVPPVAMLALNAVGYMGALMTIPSSRPGLLPIVLFGSAAGYVVSAVVRAWWLPGWRERTARDQPFDSTHGATAVASLLCAVAIGLRFSGNRETIARLLEAQLLMTAGFTLGDTWLRRFGSIALLVAAGYGWMHAGVAGTGTPLFDWAIGTTSAVLILIAAAGYGNREARARRGEAEVWLEPGFTWIATALLATVFVLEFTPAHQAFAGLLLAVVLLEAGFRRGSEYVLQSYVVGALAVYGALFAFLAPPTADGLLYRWGVAPTPMDEWLVLLGGTALAALAAWRLATRPADADVPEPRIAAGLWAAAGTAFLMTFEWRVMAPNAVAPAWALTAVGLVALGLWKQLWPLRWLGYAATVFPIVRSIVPLIDVAPESNAATAAAIAVIASTYVAGYLGRRALPGTVPTTESGDSPEHAVVAGLSVVATASLALFKWRVLPELMVAPAWAVTALVLVVLGTRRARGGQRWQGYALASLGALRIVSLLLEHPTATNEAALWSAGVIATIYATAWFARTNQPSAGDAVAPQALPVLGTLALAVLESRLLEDPMLGPALALTGAVFLMMGYWRGKIDLRWQAYALLGVGALRAGGPVFSVPNAATDAISWLLVVVAVLYACGMAVRRLSRPSDNSHSMREVEDFVGAAALLVATAMLAGTIIKELRPSLVTLALGAQGLALMFIGLIGRERVMRLSGLGLLMACILKLFVFDLRELEALARIMSFVALGLFLLAISWTYTRYREQIRKFL